MFKMHKAHFDQRRPALFIAASHVLQMSHVEMEAAQAS
jgi:hypothetical protein